MLDIKNLVIPTNEIYDTGWAGKNISLSLLRLDGIHPVISGNKVFKLNYFLQKAMEGNLRIITFGGAYSNHLAATAAACRHHRIPCIGMVRGEKPVTLSPTLLFCNQQGMMLEFVDRHAYKKRKKYLSGMI